MARIETYGLDAAISSNDIILGTDGDNNNATKNFSVQALKDFVINGLSPIDGGTLKITEVIGDIGENTPEGIINSLDPAYIVEPYEIVIVTCDNDTKYLFTKNNDTFGVDETQTVLADFIKIYEVFTAPTVDGSETKVTQGTNITVTGSGTIASPYVVNATIPTPLTPPLESLDETNGVGIRIRGKNASHYGNIGLDAFDISYSDTASSTFGATGENSFASGIDNISSGFNSATWGYKNINNAIGGVSTGFNNNNDGYTNSVSGIGHDVTSMNTTVVGQASNIIDEQVLDFNHTNKPMFVVGNGTITNNDPYYTVLTRSDAFKVMFNGTALLPTVTNAEIVAEATGKAIVTREYLESLSNKQKTITTSYSLVEADNNYTIIVNNGATPINITVPTGLSSAFFVGFIQKGTADVTFVASGTTLLNPIGLKSKGQYYNTALEQEGASNTFYLLGNTKV